MLLKLSPSLVCVEKFHGAVAHRQNSPKIVDQSMFLQATNSDLNVSHYVLWDHEGAATSGVLPAMRRHSSRCCGREKDRHDEARLQRQDM